MDRDFFWCINTQANLIAANFNNRQFNTITDDDTFTFFST